MRDCLVKIRNPLSLICASHLCQKYGKVSSSTEFSCPQHTFTCVLYREQHKLPRATTNDPLVSFKVPLLIKWLYPPFRLRRKSEMCHTSFNVNVHSILVCMSMSPIPTIWETLLFPIFTVPKSHALYVEKYSLLGTKWYDATESTPAFSCPPHTFTCVLYKEQHKMSCATTNDPFVSFQLPLLIKWLYPSLSKICTKIRFRCKSGMCRTSFNVNVHPILVCMQMSPISVIWETLLFPIFIVPKSCALYVEKCYLFGTQW